MNKGGYKLVFNCFIDVPGLDPEVEKIMRKNIIHVTQVVGVSYYFCHLDFLSHCTST